MEHAVRVILREKGDEVYQVAPSCSVCDAVQQMARHKVGCLVVMEEGALRGLFTEREVLMRVVGEARHPRHTTVEEVMVRDPEVVGTETPVGDAMRLMTDRRTRHLPVVRDGVVVGIVSIGDLTRWVSQGLEDEVHTLHSYITGALA